MTLLIAAFIDALIPGRRQPQGGPPNGGSWMPNRQSRDFTLTWRKSKASNEANECVEMASTRRSVLVRDSRDPAGAVLEFSPAQWSSFVRCIREDDGLSAG